MSRTKMREQAFKLIYSLEIQESDNLDEQIDLYLEGCEIEKEETIEYIKDIVIRN